MDSPVVQIDSHSNRHLKYTKKEKDGGKKDRKEGNEKSGDMMPGCNTHLIYANERKIQMNIFEWKQRSHPCNHKKKHTYKTHKQTRTLEKRKPFLRCIHWPALHTISRCSACYLERQWPSGVQLQRVADYSHRVLATHRLSATNWANQHS